MKYESVPNIIGTKDLSYLEDMFKWNYELYKQSNNYETKVKDKKAKQLIQKIKKISDSNMNTILSIIKEGKVHE